MPPVELVGGELVVNYARALYKTDLSIIVETSTSLDTGWTSAGIIDTLISTAAETEIRRASVGVLPAPGRSFLRFSISIP